MRRGKPLLTRTPLAAKNPLRTKKRPNTLSQRRKAEISDTKAARAEYLATHPHCEIGYAMSRSPNPEITRHYRGTCWGEATEVHERKKRSQGGSLIDPVNLMSACSPCNGWVENFPDLAEELGCVVKSTQDPQYVPVIRFPVFGETE
jgi:hypothetical protein